MFAAFTAFQCTSSSPNAKKIASKVSDSHSTNRYSNGVRQDAAAPTKDSNGHVSKNDSERTAHDSKTRERSRKSRVLLSESPTTPILSQEKQPRLGSLSSSTPLRRRVNAPSVNGPPLKVERVPIDMKCAVCVAFSSAAWPVHRQTSGNAGPWSKYACMLMQDFKPNTSACKRGTCRSDLNT
jgi:hypothetical protein